MYVCMRIYVRAAAYSLNCHVGAMVSHRLYRTFQSLVFRGDGEYTMVFTVVRLVKIK